MFKPTCLKNGPWGNAILEQYDLRVARSGPAQALTPEEKRWFSAVTYFEPSVYVFRRNEIARARWMGLILFIREHIVNMYLYKTLDTIETKTEGRNVKKIPGSPAQRLASGRCASIKSILIRDKTLNHLRRILPKSKVQLLTLQLF